MLQKDIKARLKFNKRELVDKLYLFVAGGAHGFTHRRQGEC